MRCFMIAGNNIITQCSGFFNSFCDFSQRLFFLFMSLLIFSPLPNFARAIFLYVVFCWIAAAPRSLAQNRQRAARRFGRSAASGSGVGKIAPVGLRCGRSPTGSYISHVAQSATPHRKRPRWRFASLPSSPAVRLSLSLSPALLPFAASSPLYSPSPACVRVICEHARNSGRAAAPSAAPLARSGRRLWAVFSALRGQNLAGGLVAVLLRVARFCTILFLPFPRVARFLPIFDIYLHIYYDI